MKDKILLFIIGLLLGAVISTGAFFVYTKATTCNNSNNHGENPPSMQNGQPPEKLDGENSNNGQPPEMPNENSSQNGN